MQLHDIAVSLDDLTDEQLLERIRIARANRTTVRPAAKSHAKKAAKKGAVTRINKVDAMVAGMSEADRLALIAALKGEG